MCTYEEKKISTKKMSLIRISIYSLFFFTYVKLHFKTLLSYENPKDNKFGGLCLVINITKLYNPCTQNAMPY